MFGFRNTGNRDHWALDDKAYSVWLALLVLFILWWLFQVALYILRAIRARSPESRLSYLPLVEELDRPARDVTWHERLDAATKIARDSFLMLFPAAVLITAVGGTSTLAILAWIFFLVSLFWQIGSLRASTPTMHAVFTLLTVPFIIALYVIAFRHAP